MDDCNINLHRRSYENNIKFTQFIEFMLKYCVTPCSSCLSVTKSCHFFLETTSGINSNTHLCFLCWSPVKKNALNADAEINLTADNLKEVFDRERERERERESEREREREPVTIGFQFGDAQLLLASIS